MTATKKKAPKAAPAKKIAPAKKPKLVKVKTPVGVEEFASAPATTPAPVEPTPAPAPEKKTAKKATTTEAKPKKMSALDAAHEVLTRENKSLNAKELIDAMTGYGLWTSPGGKTPHATLYAAILREITTKGDAARFRKTTKGHFAATPA